MFTILEPILSRYPETAELYAPDGHLLQAGDLFRFPELADALERARARGPRLASTAASRRAHLRLGVRARRLLSPEDLAAYR